MRTLLLSLVIAALAGCTGSPAPASRRVVVSVEVPEATGPVFLSGNLATLGPWKADAILMEGTNRLRTAIIDVPEGHFFEYKFTLGSWEREALGPSGMVMANFRLAPDSVAADHTITDFRKDPSFYIASPEAGGIKGQLIYWLDQPSEFLAHPRHVSIWLPPEYDHSPQMRYRVIYMSDGQNLFDPRIANTGTDWGADEAMISLSAGGIEPAIIVSTWSTPNRGLEYSPWHDGPAYARFLIEELIPRINKSFRTRTGPENTFHAGSSMGGLLSFYLVTNFPDVFGACGCVSTHFPLSEEIATRFFTGLEPIAAPDKTPYILRDIESGLKPPAGVRYRFDYGVLGLDASYGSSHAAVAAWLEANGLVQGQHYIMKTHADGDHNEASWRQQFPEILAFLLAPQQGPLP